MQIQPSRRRGPRAGVLSVVLIATLTVGFGLWAWQARSKTRFEQTYESPQALAEDVLLALQAGDRDRLELLPLSEREFEDEVYPELPAAGKIPAGYIWDDLRQKSNSSLARALAAHGGSEYVLKDVRFDGGHTVYATFVVHRKPRIVVRDRKSDEERHLALFGSVLQYGKRYKLFSYVVNR